MTKSHATKKTSAKDVARKPLASYKVTSKAKLLHSSTNVKINVAMNQTEPHLQASNKKRRYQRRGSKCPSMLSKMITGATLASLHNDDSSSSSPEDHTHLDSERSCSPCPSSPSHQDFALMSQLRHAFEEEVHVTDVNADQRS